MMHKPPVSVMLLMLALLCGCRPSFRQETAPSRFGLAPGQWMTRTELIFGTAGSDGAVAVSDDEWSSFLLEVVTPRFPDGFTVIDASGQWRQPSGRIVREPSKVLILLHDRDGAERIEEIREIYKQQFDQESVLRGSSRVWAAF